MSRRRSAGGGSRPTWKLVLLVLGGLVYGLYRFLVPPSEDAAPRPPTSRVERSTDRAPELQQQRGVEPELADRSTPDALLRAIDRRQSEVWVTSPAVVRKILRDDQEGSRHQRFLIDVAGRSVLVAHNIDLAPRVPVAVGDQLEIRGRFEWNDRGGVLHWTHHDPGGGSEEGWIRHRGRVFD